MATANAADGAAIPAPAAHAAAAAPPKKVAANWNPELDQKFVGVWGEEFLRIKQGNFKTHNWSFVTEQINKELPEGVAPFTVKQCQEKINSLKKRFAAELKKKTSTGSVNSSWVLFEVLAPYLKKLPKVIGIPGAIDSGLLEVPAPPVISTGGNVAGDEEGEYVGENAGAESDAVDQPAAGEHSEQVLSPASSQPPTPSPQPTSAESERAKRRVSAPTEDELDPGRGSPREKFEKKPGINGQINGKNKRLKGSPGGALARSIDNFTKGHAGSMMTYLGGPQVGGIMTPPRLPASDTPEDLVVVADSL
ncbi:hypothetical protein KFL_008620060 [Klebsormidium nitens]|uniref:Myb/SANT-like DNA-binding domain-containing protein n=1 Tax=Klebsormidium nitens TaxID=105231 RepID=A0A1Y1IP05_KLENI|nr:hypothetical protein KFL_008620060 [Klebsormidium nitens]|eukprot:GAQ91822.1 hypothetical protein KFL_008620060 [Klebsormidium nitens]